MAATSESALEARDRAGAGALGHYWHPVAKSEEVADHPLAVRLLDVPLVLWRSDGYIAAFYDLCIHRGTPLSLGWVEKGQLVCAYHGWHYGKDGSCTWIPSLPPGRSIPLKARAIAHRVEERYGLIWVCLGEPRADIPAFPPEFSDPAHHIVDHFEGYYRANAARFIENMMDRSHFPWVHEGYLGERSRPQVSDISIEPCEGGFRWLAEGRTRYQIILPFTLCYRPSGPNPGEWLTYLFIATPISSKETKSYGWVYRNYSHTMTDEQIKHRTRVVYEQDRRIVEAQRPEELPLDLSEELHLRGPDAAAVEYRRRLREMGVRWE